MVSPSQHAISVISLKRDIIGTIEVLEHGEYIRVIKCIPERSHKFSIPKVGSEPIGKSIC